jgi:hypothetical protein
VDTGDHCLIADLKALRKGRAVLATDLGKRVGPGLRAVLGIGPRSLLPAEFRTEVVRGLTDLVELLPDDLRIAATAGYALDERVRMPFLKERIHWAAGQLKRDARTVRRRMDEAIERIAELAVSRAGIAPEASTEEGWHTEELRVSMALDQRMPEIFEFRRIVVDTDELDEATLGVVLGAGIPDFDARVFFGARLIRCAAELANRITLRLRLPATLHQGDRHELGLRFRSPTHPHYVCVPRKPCDLFDLRVHFPYDRPPAGAWKLDRAFQRDLGDRTTAGDPVGVDRVGEIHLRFAHLEPGFAYGLRWHERR